MLLKPSKQNKLHVFYVLLQTQEKMSPLWGGDTRWLCPSAREREEVRGKIMQFVHFITISNIMPQDM